MIKFLEQFFQEDNGNASGMRLCTNLGILIIIGVWAYLSIQSGAIISWGMKDLGIVGTLLGAKYLQKGKEENIVRKEGEK